MSTEATGQTSVADRVAALERHVFHDGSLFSQAFLAAGLDGDFLEFGVGSGGSLSEAWWSAFSVLRRVASEGILDRSFVSQLAGRRAWQTGFERMRFIGFDSFAGLPEPAGVDSGHPGIVAGAWRHALHDALALLRRYGTPLDNIRLVEGAFDAVLDDDQADKLDLTKLSVVHIDSKLHASAAAALAFCTRFLRDRTVIVFSDWLQFGGVPHLGSRRAFGEWCAAHPEWHAAVLGRHPLGRIAFVLTRRREDPQRRRRGRRG